VAYSGFFKFESTDTMVGEFLADGKQQLLQKIESADIYSLALTMVRALLLIDPIELGCFKIATTAAQVKAQGLLQDIKHQYNEELYNMLKVMLNSY